MSGFNAPMTKTTENPHEMYFRWYCEELQQHGYLESFEREPETFLITPGINFKREKHFKVKPNELEEFELFPKRTYTYDFRLIWTKKAINIFTEILDFDGYFVFGMPTFVSHRINLNGQIKIVSYIDVKPHYAAVAFGGGKMKSYYTFPYVQKSLYIMKGLYINKIVPIHTGKHGRSTCLFATTFVPNRYKRTDKSLDQRNIPYKVRSLLSYCQQKEKIVNDLLKIKQGKNQQTSLL